MPTYSDLCTQASLFFAHTSEQVMKSHEESTAFWMDAVKIAFDLGMGSSTSGPRLNRIDFDRQTWKVLCGLLKPFEKIGCAEKRIGERRRIDAYVLKPEEFDPKRLRALTERRKKSQAMRVQVPIPISVAPIIRLVPTKIPRKKVEASVAIIVDLANLTRNPSGDANGRKVLDPKRINWSQLLLQLSSYGGKSLPIDRAVICVSEAYHNFNRDALRSAEKHGFTISTMFGDKEADPVVMSEIVKTIFDHLQILHADRMPTLVVATGDKDFACMLETLRPYVRREGMELTVRVVSWQSKLSSELCDVSNKISYVDDFLRYIDPYGAQLMESGARLHRD